VNPEPRNAVYPFTLDLRTPEPTNCIAKEP
jgi:hypothetical protein